jgi:hypothetical protein
MQDQSIERVPDHAVIKSDQYGRLVLKIRGKRLLRARSSDPR